MRGRQQRHGTIEQSILTTRDRTRQAVGILRVDASLGVGAIKVLHKQIKRCMRLLRSTSPKLALSGILGDVRTLIRLLSLFAIL
jgi:hypothetical protein